jgi:long-chain acyl-CoA synthetase
MSYLPLAHIYERINTVTATHGGAAIGFYSGDVARLLEDISVLRPTVFCSVPRLWNRIYDKVRCRLAVLPMARRWLQRRRCASLRWLMCCGVMHVLRWWVV